MTAVKHQVEEKKSREGSSAATKKKVVKTETKSPVANQKHVLWYDATSLEGPAPSVVRQLSEFSYTGLVVRPSQLTKWIPKKLSNVAVVLRVSNDDVLEDADLKNVAIVASDHLPHLEKAEDLGKKACYCAYVDSAETLHKAINIGRDFAYLSIKFRDPTNIPLELVIASLQKTGTILIDEIADPEDIEAALVAFGVMEVGADGVMFSPQRPEVAHRFSARLQSQFTPAVELEVATITRSEPVGMGLRACIDLATMFSPEEGMLVGSTSQGGILCCPEVFHLPYMELRPFRINAGGVHSYVFGPENTTSYITELRAGSSMLIVNHDGTTRRAPVGRIKTEMRPLRLLEAKFANGELVNILMQDDWHVRVYSDKRKPLNITELKPGDHVLAHKAKPGRHVGISIDEQIEEV